MKKSKKCCVLLTILISIVCINLMTVKTYAYTEEEKQAAKAWLSAHGYPPTMDGAQQAYNDYLNGKIGVDGSTESAPEEDSKEENADAGVGTQDEQAGVEANEGTGSTNTAQTQESQISEKGITPHTGEWNHIESGEMEYTLDESVWGMSVEKFGSYIGTQMVLTESSDTDTTQTYISVITTDTKIKEMALFIFSKENGLQCIQYSRLYNSQKELDDAVVHASKAFSRILPEDTIERSTLYGKWEGANSLVAIALKQPVIRDYMKITEEHTVFTNLTILCSKQFLSDETDMTTELIRSKLVTLGVM